MAKKDEYIELTPAEKEWRENTDQVVDGYEVFKWPETQAFMRRLGIPVERDYQVVTVRFGIGEMPKITLEGNGREPKRDPIETTTNHNDRYKMFAQPVELTEALK